jgi:hypothetical protein
MILFVTFASAKDTSHKKVSLDISIPLLKSIESSAIRLGEGKTEVYVFLDPYCPHSQNFFEMINESKKMQKKYSYHIFLYELKRMKSHEIIRDIYANNNLLLQLQKLMVNKVNIPKTVKLNESIENKIETIEVIAKQLNVYKRPYLIMNKKRKSKK